MISHLNHLFPSFFPAINLTFLDFPSTFTPKRISHAKREGVKCQTYSFIFSLWFFRMVSFGFSLDNIRSLKVLSEKS